jgi:hypothetical protein
MIHVDGNLEMDAIQPPQIESTASPFNRFINNPSTNQPRVGIRQHLVSDIPFFLKRFDNI